MAQTLAARMRGAQVKPELAELHCARYAAVLKIFFRSPVFIPPVSVDPWTAVQSGSLEHLDVALSASISFDLDALDKSTDHHLL